MPKHKSHKARNVSFGDLSWTFRLNALPCSHQLPFLRPVDVYQLHSSAFAFSISKLRGLLFDDRLNGSISLNLGIVYRIFKLKQPGQVRKKKRQNVRRVFIQSDKSMADLEAEVSHSSKTPRSPEVLMFVRLFPKKSQTMLRYNYVKIF